MTVVAFWACAQLEANRERLALHCLRLGGFTTYLPRLLERRLIKGRTVISKLPLFPGYAFVWIELQWHAARWCPGVLRLVLDGAQPAKVPDQVIADLKKRERTARLSSHHRPISNVATGCESHGDSSLVSSPCLMGCAGMSELRSCCSCSGAWSSRKATSPALS